VARIYIETYGCWLNKADSRIMEDIARRKGFRIVHHISDADIVILNTCTVRGDTERRMIRRIRELEELRRKHNFRLLIAGCLTPIRGATIHSISPTASLIGPNSIDSLSLFLEGKRVIDVNPFKPRTCPILPEYDPLRDGVVHIVPISVGCLGSCTFCVEVYARRRLTSYDAEKIIENVLKAVSKGAKLVVLTGQDVAAYGRDKGGRLTDLLERLLKSTAGKEVYFRLGMMEPSLVLDMLDDLVEVFNDPRIIKYLHLPLQSGDNNVLSMMGRRYTVEEFKEIVSKFRKRFPDIFLATDIIVGFPGEGDEEFHNTVTVLKEIKPDKVHVARYTLTPFTRGYVSKQVPEPIKKRRSQIISRLTEKLALEINRKYIGKTVKALTLETLGERNETRARLFNYKPLILYERIRPGKVVKAKINEVTFFDLRGEIVCS